MPARWSGMISGSSAITRARCRNFRGETQGVANPGQLDPQRQARLRRFRSDGQTAYNSDCQWRWAGQHNLERQWGWHSAGKFDPHLQPWLHDPEGGPWFRSAQRRAGGQRNGRDAGGAQRGSPAKGATFILELPLLQQSRPEPAIPNRQFLFSGATRF